MPTEAARTVLIHSLGIAIMGPAIGRISYALFQMFGMSYFWAQVFAVTLVGFVFHMVLAEWLNFKGVNAASVGVGAAILTALAVHERSGGNLPEPLVGLVMVVACFVILRAYSSGPKPNGWRKSRV